MQSSSCLTASGRPSGWALGIEGGVLSLGGVTTQNRGRGILSILPLAFTPCAICYLVLLLEACTANCHIFAPSIRPMPTPRASRSSVTCPSMSAGTPRTSGPTRSSLSSGPRDPRPTSAECHRMPSQRQVRGVGQTWLHNSSWITPFSETNLCDAIVNAWC